MRIILLHVPPLKIYETKEKPVGDYTLIPYGLLSIGAQALKRGHDVNVLNVSNFFWNEIEILIRNLQADVFGMSCLTINRHGVNIVSRLIREYHANAHIVAGGPHVSALPVETLENYPHIDTVVIGEGEETFLEIVDHIEQERAVEKIPGTAYRTASGIQLAVPRKRIENIDFLSSPLDSFSTSTILTSRGCPGKCTFCGSNMMWGKKLKFNSVEYTLNVLEKAIKKHGHKIISIKDDTFTFNRKRALNICRGIRDRHLNFIWSCDTRVDYLDEELLFEMRLSGCNLLSFGVESGSPEILKSIKKGISLEKVKEISRVARKFGFQIRYYMIVGNRGENLESFKQSLKLIDQEKPHQYMFNVLSYYPGTEEFKLLAEKGVQTENYFFESERGELTLFGNNTPEEKEIMAILASRLKKQTVLSYSLDESEEILKIFPDLSSAHLDMGGALLRSGQADRAEIHIKKAIDLEYPLLGLAYNYLAGIAAVRGDFISVKMNLEKALTFYPHPIVLHNRDAFYEWVGKKGNENKIPFYLNMNHSFEFFKMSSQPELPGPIRLNYIHQKGWIDIGEKLDSAIEAFSWSPERLILN